LSDILGTDLLRHSVGGPPSKDAEDEHYREAAEGLRKAADIAARNGKRIAVEIHHGSLPDTASSAVELLERTDRDNVGAIHDAGNMYIVDTEFGRESIEELGDWLAHVHIKDERRIDDPNADSAFTAETKHGTEIFQHCLLGHGAVDHKPIFQTLDEIGYDGYTSVECHRENGDVWTDVAVAAHERELIDRLQSM
jgi:sugar phosphate isomerase/epimerase